MTERPLEIIQNNDPALVITTSEMLKETRELILAIAELDRRLKDKSLEVGLSYTLMSVAESGLQKLGKSLSYDGHLAKEMEARFAKVRSLNIENRELRRQLGEKVSMEDVREALKNLGAKIYKWWNFEGLGFSESQLFLGAGVKVVLSGNLTGMRYNDVEPKEDKKLRFEAQGYKFNDEYLSVESLPKIIEFIKERFPSAKVSRCEISRGSDVRQIEIMIYNFDEI